MIVMKTASLCAAFKKSMFSRLFVGPFNFICLYIDIYIHIYVYGYDIEGKRHTRNKIGHCLCIGLHGHD